MKNKTILLLCGAPNSGKSTLAYHVLEECSDTIYLNADTLRQAITGDISDQSQNGLVFRVFDNMLEYFMILGNDIIIDNCNVKPSYRRKYIEAAKSHGYEVLAIVFDVPLDILLERNKERERKVPEEVIEKFYNDLKNNMPKMEEGFTKIDIIEVKRK